MLASLLAMALGWRLLVCKQLPETSQSEELVLESCKQFAMTFQSSVLPQCSFPGILLSALGPAAPLQTHPAAHRKSIVKTCVSRTERQLHGEVPPVDIPDSVLSHQALVFVVYNLGYQWEPSGTRDLDWRLPPADWPMGMSVCGGVFP